MLDAKTPTNKHNQALYMFMILKNKKNYTCKTHESSKNNN